MALTHSFIVYLGLIFSYYLVLATSQDTSKLSAEVDEKAEENIGEIKIDEQYKAQPEQRFTEDQNEKRNIGRWKNHSWNLQKYKQDREKRFIGRWKNINWLNYRHGIPDGQTSYDDLDKRVDGYFNEIGMDNEFSPYLYGYDKVKKRQGGRWALIQRQLNKLGYGSARNKKDEIFDEYSSDDDEIDKRMGSRWMLIQNKLKDLTGRSKRSVRDDKRFIGRWKNHNWMLGHGRSNYNYALPLNEKRNIGRWKNQNWLLKQHRDRKSNGFNL